MLLDVECWMWLWIRMVVDGHKPDPITRAEIIKKFTAGNNLTLQHALLVWPMENTDHVPFPKVELRQVSQSTIDDAKHDEAAAPQANTEPVDVDLDQIIKLRSKTPRQNSSLSRLVGSLTDYYLRPCQDTDYPEDPQAWLVRARQLINLRRFKSAPSAQPGTEENAPAPTASPPVQTQAPADPTPALPAAPKYEEEMKGDGRPEKENPTLGDSE
jgi:hypothetical protein